MFYLQNYLTLIVSIKKKTKTDYEKPSTHIHSTKVENPMAP